jgi:hypothetical protein
MTVREPVINEANQRYLNLIMDYRVSAAPRLAFRSPGATAR